MYFYSKFHSSIVIGPIQIYSHCSDSSWSIHIAFILIPLKITSLFDIGASPQISNISWRSWVRHKTCWSQESGSNSSDRPTSNSGAQPRLLHVIWSYKLRTNRYQSLSDTWHDYKVLQNCSCQFSSYSSEENLEPTWTCRSADRETTTSTSLCSNLCRSGRHFSLPSHQTKDYLDILVKESFYCLTDANDGSKNFRSKLRFTVVGTTFKHFSCE